MTPTTPQRIADALTVRRGDVADDFLFNLATLDVTLRQSGRVKIEHGAQPGGLLYSKGVEHGAALVLDSLYAEVRELARAVHDEIGERYGDGAIMDELRVLCLYGASGTYTIPRNEP